MQKTPLNQQTDNIPFYIKGTVLLLGLFALFTALYILKEVILPLMYSSIIAIVLHPFVSFLVRKKINRILAVSIAVLLFVSFFVIIVSVLSTQLSFFTDSFPQLSVKFNALFKQIEAWLIGNFNVSHRQIDAWISDINLKLQSNIQTIVSYTLSGIGNILIVMFLIPVYVFLLLVYQPLFMGFFHKIFASEKQHTLSDVLTATKNVIQSYLIGLLLEALIVAGLNITALLIIGVDYAILLGAIGAILNIIPYLGGIIAVSLPMVIALATLSPAHAIVVLGAYLFIQLLDNNFIIPKIVASKVQINALASITAVFLGGALWGVGGMFLSIPVTAVLKVVFDRIDSLKPWGYLLGNNEKA